MLPKESELRQGFNKLKLWEASVGWVERVKGKSGTYHIYSWNNLD